MPSSDLELLTVGRISIDLYCDQLGANWHAARTFSKAVGGSPTNVAIAAARGAARVRRRPALRRGRAGNGDTGRVRAQNTIAIVPVLWISGGALSQEPSRSTVQAMLEARGRREHTILDLDYRPSFVLELLGQDLQNAGEVRVWNG